MQPAPMQLEAQSRFRCCCNCCDVKTGAIIIAVLELLSVAPYVGVIYGSGLWILWIPGVTFYVLYIVTAILLIIGCATEKAPLLIVHLIAQIFGMLYYAILAVIGILMITRILCDNNPECNSFSDPWVFGWTLLAICVIGLIFQIWFFTVVLSCFKYLKARKYQTLYQMQPTSTQVTVSGINYAQPAPYIVSQPPGYAAYPSQPGYPAQTGDAQQAQPGVYPTQSGYTQQPGYPDQKSAAQPPTYAGQGESFDVST